MNRLTFLPALLLALWSLGAGGQSDVDRDTCASGNSPDNVMAACTRLITSGKLSAGELGLAFKRRGDARYKTSDYDRAIADYSEALRINPKDADVYVLRATAWMGKYDEDRAIADYNEALRIDPRHVVAYIKRGDAWIRSEKYDNDRAIADYNEALRIDPKAWEAYHGRGTAWYNKHDYDRAIADLTEVLRLDTQNAGAYRVRAHAWGGKRNEDRFMADLNEALRINPGYVGIYIDRGRFWEYKHDYARALADYNEALRISPNNGIAQNAAAWLLAAAPVDAIRNGARAVKLGTMAVEVLNWKSANRVDTLAAAYAELGNFALAVRLQEKALESDEFMKSSEGPSARQRLALYRKQQPYRITPKP